MIKLSILKDDEEKAKYEDIQKKRQKGAGKGSLQVQPKAEIPDKGPTIEEVDRAGHAAVR